SWSEQTAHNRPVIGSNPIRSIWFLNVICYIRISITKRLSCFKLLRLESVADCSGFFLLDCLLLLTNGIT
ncbi:hypothetical protein, partial [Bacillus thuringiensis]